MMLDIIKEINRLPNFGYVFWGDDNREHLAVLGGHSSKKSETYEWAENILNIAYEMQRIYEQSNLSVEDKIKLAKLMQKMHSLCETRKIGLHSINEQEAYLNKLSKSELVQIEQQLKMHLDCRNFYRNSVFEK